MIQSQCDQCGQESSYSDGFAGLKVKCKKCPNGWVTLPPREGVIAYTQTVALPPPAPPVPPPSLSSSETTSPPQIPWKRPSDSMPPAVDEGWEHFKKYGLAYLFAGSIGFLGIGSLALRQVGLQFSSLMFLEPHQPVVGLVMTVVGIPGWAMLYIHRHRGTGP